jgi:hypothetical protein
MFAIFLYELHQSSGDVYLAPVAYIMLNQCRTVFFRQFKSLNYCDFSLWNVKNDRERFLDFVAVGFVLESVVCPAPRVLFIKTFDHILSFSNFFVSKSGLRFHFERWAILNRYAVVFFREIRYSSYCDFSI